jgi:cytochrome c553/peroxiredoxin
MSQTGNCSACRPSALFRIGLWLFILAASVWGGRWLRATMQDRAAEAPAVASVEESDSNHSARAEFLYHTLCAKCHGPEGHGDGEGITELAQRPRDFAGDRWRFPKTKESIRQVIAEGIPGTAMPGSKQALSAADVDALADYVLVLAERPAPHHASADARRSPSALERALEAAGFRPVPPRPAPPLTVVRTDGEPLSLAELQGTSVLLHFWGTSCVHCLTEFKSLHELENIGRMRIVSICIDESEPESVEAVGRVYAGDHPLYLDETGLLAHRYQVQTLPAYMLIDPHGRLVANRTGAGAWSGNAVSGLIDQLTEGER